MADLEGGENFLDKGHIVAANGKIFAAMLNLLHAKA